MYCKGSRQDRGSYACAGGDDACAVIRGESLSSPGKFDINCNVAGEGSDIGVELVKICEQNGGFGLKVKESKQ